MISGNYTNYNPQRGNISYGAVKDVVPENLNEKLPESIQNIDAKQVAEGNAAVNSAMGFNKETFLATLPIYASFVALRSINDSPKGPFTFAGEYEKSFLGKLAKAGDFIAKGFSKIVPDNIENGAAKAVQNIKNFALKHSSLARAATTPMVYENSTALQEANGLFGRVIFDDVTLFEKGFSGDIKALFKGDGKSSFWNLLKSKGIEAADNEGAKSIVMDTFKELAQKPVKSKEVQQYAVDLVEALSKSNESIVIDHINAGIPLTKIKGKLPMGKFMTLKVPMSELANKIRVAAGLSGEQLAVAGTGAAAVGTTALGRGLPSVFAKLYEGLTSDFVGGKIAPFVQAFFLAQAGIKASEAPKGKKLATFMDEEASAASFLITMPIAAKLLTKITGMTKYIGMGATPAEQQQNVKAFRDMVKALNERVDAGTITRGEYLNEAKKIKNLLNGKDINGKNMLKLWQKPFKAIGKILGSNLKNETIKPFVDTNIPADYSSLKTMGISVSNKAKSLLYKLKTGGFGATPGGALRFILVMFVLSPLVTKPIKYVVNKIFGKPYDKEAEEKAKQPQNETDKNNPFLNMTDNEFIDLMTKNKDTLEKIQQDPELMQQIQKDPQMLYQILQNGAKERNEAMKNAPKSSMLQNYINNQKAQSNIEPSVNYNPPLNGQNTANMENGLNQNNLNTNAKMPAPSIKPEEKAKEENNQPVEPKRTYIPSSKPADFLTEAKKQQDARFNAIISDMDKTEQEFQKYLHI